MARLAFFNLPAYGHVNPTLPVVAELIRRGESVVYYCGEEFRQGVERSGAEFRSYSPPLEEDPGEAAANPLHLAAFLLETSSDVLPSVLQDLEKNPVDYVIHDSVCPWGRYAAQILRLPAVCSSTTFALRSELFLPGTARSRLWSVPATLLRNLPSLRRIRRSRRYLDSVYGVTATRVFDVLANRAGLNIVYTAREFQPRAELFDDSYRFVGPPVTPVEPDAEFARELGDAPVIYISLGTIFNQAPDFYQTCLRALGGLPQRVVMSVGRQTDVSQLGPVPSNFVIRNWAPQRFVLSRASLFLTRGGLNSVSESLLAGVPLLVFPQIGEQQLVATQVRDAGAGLIMSERGLRADDLRRKVDLVSGDPRFQQAAQRMGVTLRAGGGHEKAADEILRYRESQVR